MLIKVENMSVNKANVNTSKIVQLRERLSWK